MNPDMIESLDCVLVSRCDRIGDLILSLPVLGLLRDAGVSKRILHCSAYAADIGEWAKFNNLCTDIWIEGHPPPSVARSAQAGLSLFHCKEAVRAFKSLSLKHTLGPRSKLSALWSYSQSLAQHRSRVEKSEMHYNLDLAKALLGESGLELPDFKGLPALKVPPAWVSPRKSPHTVVVVSNNASAANWSIDHYIRYAMEAYDSTGRSLDFLVSGHDARFRRDALARSEAVRSGMGLVDAFPTLKELIAYLSGAQLVVSSSTGPLHIAHAAGVNVFGIYPSKRVESFDRWRPDGYWHKGFVRYQVMRSDEAL
jgi:heptosyltransferase-3